MAGISTRKPVRDDHAQWARLWAGYNAFYGRHGATALPDSITDATWARLLDPDEPVHAFVAELQGRLVGLAHVVLHRSTIQLQPNCYLQDLYASEDARGRGVGRRLLEAVCDFARGEGLPRVYWQTHETNQAAMRLYDKVADRTGFLVYRRLL